MTTTTTTRRDPEAELNFIMRLECGEIEDDNEIIAGFQMLINSGIVWHLQGSYGRTASHLIEAGYCHPAVTLN